MWRALHRLQPCGISPPERWAYPSDMQGRGGGDTSTDTEDDEEPADAPRRQHELKDLSAPNGHGVPKAAS